MEKWKNDAIELKQKIEGINNWIKENPQVTSPNMYEYTQVLVEFGEILNQADEYYQENGYPQDIDASFGHYHLWEKIPEFLELKIEIGKLEQLRNLKDMHGNPDVSFVSIDEVREFLTELNYREITAEYRVPKNDSIRNMKKEVLCKCMAISFYIWDTQRKEPGYVYDNKNEYDLIRAMYDTYVKSEGIQESYVGDGVDYEGPQFGRVIEGIFKYIDKNYVYAEENTNAKIK
jgi:hypothetical protein